MHQASPTTALPKPAVHRRRDPIRTAFRRWVSGLLAAVAATGALGAGALLVAPSAAQGQCIDEAIRDELNARRRYRGVRPRLFQKAARHEISAMGGLYAADLYSSSWMVQGAYTYHVTEELGLEAAFGYTRSDSEVVRIIEDELNVSLLREARDVYIYTAHVLWSVAYGKMRWFGDGISRFDLHLAIGGGLTDNASARGLTFSGGIGLKLYFTEWFAVRIDIRDQLLQQEALGESRIVQNIAATLGLSVFLPPEA